MVVVQLMASPFFGGPERQVVGLAEGLSPDIRTVFLTFADDDRDRSLLGELARRGLPGRAISRNYPDIPGAVREVARNLRELDADLLCCNGYKPDIIGLLAARQVGIPAVAIAHGWTSATWKVRLNETADRLALAWMDAVVCVSGAQAVKVKHAGVKADKVNVIHNAINADEIADHDAGVRDGLEKQFAEKPRHIVGAAGRLSPEKGMDQLVEAASLVRARDSGVAFVVFGEGPERQKLEALIIEKGLQDKFVLAGFREDVGRLLPCLDVAVLPSWTEGLPVILLEALAAGVPVVATAVGGIPEVIADGVVGYLVPPGQPQLLAERIGGLLRDDERRRSMGRQGQERVRRDFTVARQAESYRHLFEALMRRSESAADKRRPACCMA